MNQTPKGRLSPKNKPWKYKGYIIEQVGRRWVVKSHDEMKTFETKAAAQAFVNVITGDFLKGSEPYQGTLPDDDDPTTY